MQAAMEGLTCHTAPGVTFASTEELKEHYRSDWHRYKCAQYINLTLRTIDARVSLLLTCALRGRSAPL